MGVTRRLSSRRGWIRCGRGMEDETCDVSVYRPERGESLSPSSLSKVSVPFLEEKGVPGEESDTQNSFNSPLLPRRVRVFGG